MITRIINARIIRGDDVLDGYSLYFSEEGILALSAEERAHDCVIDAKGAYLAPGFIDIHSHGGGDADFMDGTPEAFCQAARMHAGHGTTTILPTATSGSREEMLVMTDVFEEACRQNTSGADMPGLHLEGPYFAMTQCGAQDPRYVRAPKPEEYLQILNATDRIVRWSAAPELDGALAFGRELERRGILASIGHTDADYDQVIAGSQAGYRHVTHLYSCMSTVHRKNAYRYAGVVEAAYMLDDLTVEIIADGVHLPASLLQFVYRFKGPDKIALVTDSMRGAGMPDGLSILGSRQNGQQVLIEDGVAKLMDRSAFAGSAATSDRLVRTMITLGGATLTDAVKMATATPARIMGWTDRGELSEGRRADLVLFDDDIQIQRTIINGKTVYTKEG